MASTEVIIALVVIAVVIVLVLVICLICCLCRKCDQCARWSRRKANDREELATNEAKAENRRVFDETRQQHDVVRDQLRVKYNLHGGTSNVAVLT